MVARKDNHDSQATSLDPVTSGRQDAGFPIIGAGASAGGLEAFEQFFRHIPPDSGMAFVLVPHLDPGHASILTEILQRATAMHVVEAQDQMVVAPNHVYVIQPNRDMAIFHGALQLSVPEQPRGQRMPIDSFLRSLAEEQRDNAIAVIFSGTGTDGTLGLRAILGAGGVSFVQDPSTAQYDGMPTSAIQSGLATYILPVEKMPAQLLAYTKTLLRQKSMPRPAVPATSDGLNRILMLLRSGTGNDFSLYKKSTIGRRIERRMTVHGIDELDIYARYLKEHPAELQLLFKELLITVTSFFRDPEAFAALKKDILPQLLQGKPEDHAFRIWVAGCATGEEAYSLAMVFREYMDESHQEYKVQIYATDLDADTISVARAGVYPLNIITADVAQTRLRRFFVKDEAGYRVKKNIREMIVFATQNVIKDPPFTKLDLVSCRNLLIYLEPELQDRVISAFHYALKPGGVLFLSASESIGHHTDLFLPVNRKWKFYQATPSVASIRAVISSGLAWTSERSGKGPEEAVKKAKKPNVAELATRVLLQSYAPASVVTDEKGDILYVYGDTGNYLRPAPGQASLNIIEMARDGLQLELRTAIRSAATQKTAAVCKGLRVKTNGDVRRVDVMVRPLLDPDAVEGLLIVSFQETALQARGQATRGRRAAEPGASKRVEELELELAYLKENLHATLEEQQASNEELKSTNEELQSTNEELQSTNEELETSKEELQSVNEELATVNAELQAKIEHSVQMQNDMKNLFDNTNVGTIFLDDRLAIRRFNRDATKLFHLVASDVGRPLADIKPNIEGADMLAEGQAVLDALAPREREVQTTSQDWYLVRIAPYRTLDNVIAGVVLNFTDITKRKLAEDEVKESREYAERIVDTVREPLIVLDGDLRVVSASRSFYRTFRVSPEETRGRYLYDLGSHQWDLPRLRELLGTILPRDTYFDDIEVDVDLPVLGRTRMLLNARRITGKKGTTKLILLAIEPIHDRPLTEPQTGASTGGA